MVAAAVCPHPPMLVPEVAAGAAAELDDLRAACDAAVAHLAASGATTLVVIGTGPSTMVPTYPFHGAFAPWGVPLEASIGPPRPSSEPPSSDPLPLSLLMGAWLIGRVTPGERPVTYDMRSLATTSDPDECASVGREAAAVGPATALLIMGDGSARRGLKAPGYEDSRAAPFDESVAAALAKADRDALRNLDPALAEDLMATGRGPWQALAAAADDGRDWRGDLLYADAPYGVGYFVATWTPA